MPGGLQHGLLTRTALDLLPSCFRLPAGERNALIEEYCLYPDMFFSLDKSVYEKILPYTFIKDGIQFHYPPNTPIEKLYRYWLPVPDEGRLEKSRPFSNDNFLHVKDGFTFYLDHIAACFAAKNYSDGAKFAGCLLHMLEDACFGAHSIEGPLGTDIFVLERLFERRDDELNRTPLGILASLDCSRIEPVEYQPRLLGESVSEIVMHLYAAYAESVAVSRRICFSIVQNVYQNNQGENAGLVQRMFANAAKICADALFSVWCVAKQRFDASADLREVCLTRLEPHAFPLGGSGGYHFLSYLKNIAVGGNMKRIPLQLRLDNEVVSFDRGLSWGSHFEASLLYWLPDNTYSVFDAAIGLHPDSIDELSGVRIRLINDGKEVDEFDFEAGRPATRIAIDHPRGDFGFTISYLPGAPHRNSIIVVGDPMLRK